MKTVFLSVFSVTSILKKNRRNNGIYHYNSYLHIVRIKVMRSSCDNNGKGNYYGR